MDREKLRRQIVVKRTKSVFYCFFSVSFIIFMSHCGTDDSLKYIYEKVSEGEVVKNVFVSGTIDVLDYTVIKSKVSGNEIHLLKDENSPVRKGEIVAVLKNDDIAYDLMQSRESLLRQRIDLQVASEKMELNKKLFEENLVSEKQFIETKRAYEKVQSLYRITVASNNKLIIEKNNLNIVSPINGTVIKLHVDEGEGVSREKAIYDITSDMKKMQMILDIAEADVGSIKKGMPVSFEVTAYPGKKFTGKVNEISISSKKKNNIVTYTAWADCDNSELLLKPGMSAVAVIMVGHKEKVLRVPNDAFSVSPFFVEYEPGKRFVWKKSSGAENGMIRIQIFPGLIGSDYTEVLSGKINVNDEVMVKIQSEGKKKSIPGLQ